MATTKRAPTHPGEILRKDVLPELGVSVSQAARDLKMSRNLLHGILAERKSITPESAVKIGKYCGNGPGLWLRMQTAYDLYQAEQNMIEVLKDIPRASAA